MNLTGGLVGVKNGGTVTDSYWDVEASGQSTSDGGEGKTTAEMKQQSTYVGWDFTSIWAIVENESYPYLQALGPTVELPTVEEREIWSLSDLNKIGRDVGYPINGRYRLMTDIDASETVNWNQGKGFKPIPFVGEFYGDGHVIRNLYIDRVGENYIGLFSIVYRGGAIWNLGLENIYIRGSENIGGLVGYNMGSVINCYSTGSVTGSVRIGGLVGRNVGRVENSGSACAIEGGNTAGGLIGENDGSVEICHYENSDEGVSGVYYIGGLIGENYYGGLIRNSYSIATVNGVEDVGGLVGDNYERVERCYASCAISGSGRYIGGLLGENYGNVQDCYSGGSVIGTNAEYVGGLVGYNGDGVIHMCYSTSYVEGGNYVGGLVGENDATVDQCYSTGGVLGNGEYIGGLVGYNGYVVIYCYSMSPTTGNNYVGGLVGGNVGENSYILECYSAGAVTGNTQVGGLVGWNDLGLVELSYWDIDTSGQNSSAGGEGRSTEMMKRQATFVGWDFVNEWGIVEEVTYPYLRWQYRVPDVVGLSRDDAEAMIISAGLIVGTVTEGCSDSVPAGNVISQNPVGGEQVPPGTAVNLVVSTGPCPVNVPDVVGLAQSEAESVILGAGLTVGVVTQECSNSVPAGRVISQNPVGGEQVPSGTAVNLVISSGPCSVSVPDVVGLAQSVAESVILGAGLTVGVITQECSDSVPAGNVISQEPLSGEQVPPGTAMNLVISSGPCPEGEGSSEGEVLVIQISSIQELQKIGNDPGYPLDGQYELTQDIDASETINWNNGEGYAPIGNYSNPFIGEFDGKGYVIRNLYINRPGQDFVGLFGSVGSGGKVKNVGLENVQVVGNDYVGGLVGVNGGTVSQSYSTGSVAGDEGVGAFVGYNTGIVTQSYSTGSVRGTWYIGGLVGWNYGGTVRQSYSTGSLEGDYDVGGLVGYNTGTISQSYSTGSVVGNTGVGGFVGINYGTVEQSYSTGSVSGQSAVGGLVGWNDGGTITQSYSTGSVLGSNNVGGLVGWNNLGTVTQSYWNMETSYQNWSDGGEGKTTAEMKQQATFVGWDFVNVWRIDEGRSYPYFGWQPLFIVPNVVGMAQWVAENVILGAGLTVGVITQECSDSVPAGNVISQEPLSGEQVPPGTAVNLVISSGPCPEGEGSSEGTTEGSTEGERPPHSADQNGDWQINLSELLRVIQFFNSGGYHCALPGEQSEDGYIPGYEGDKTCSPHASDYNPQDWQISLSELLRLIQFFNMGGYHPCPDGEDGYCPGLQ